MVPTSVADTEGDESCASFGMGAIPPTLFELDVDDHAASVFAAHPDLRRIPLNINLGAFLGAPVMDATLNELNLFATDIGQITVAAALDASPAVRVSADLRHPDQRHQSRRRRVRPP